MSISDKIITLTSCRNAMRTSIINKGIDASTHGMEDFGNDIREIVVPGAKPTLNAPTIALNGTQFTITNPASNGDFVTRFGIYIDSVFLKNISTNTFLVSDLTSGTHNVSVLCKNPSFNNSALSNAIQYTR